MTAPLIRLADRLRTLAPKPAFDPISLSDANARFMSETLDRITSALRAGVPVIVGDPVSEYYYCGSDQEDWQIKGDFPCLVPPFPNFWIEWTQPSQIRSRVYGVTRPETACFSMTGTLASVRRPDEASAWWNPVNRAEFLALIDGCEWVWRFTSVGYLTGKMAAALHMDDTFAVPVGDFWITTDALGNVVNYVVSSQADGPSITGEPYIDLLGREVPLFLHPGLLTITFLNLKNGTLAPAALHAPPKFAKNYAKRHDQELVRYHTVIVDPNRTTKPTLPGAGTGREMPVHLVRGHFVTYPDEPGKRLFGRYAGTFFREAHVRGSAKEGVSHHDYTVRAPRGRNDTWNVRAKREGA
jgi:hypothetical protein